MRRLIFSLSAKRDLVEIQANLANLSASLPMARTFVSELREKCRHLSSLNGTLGRPRPELGEGLRSFAHGNYVIFFRYRDDRFEVIAILHGARDIDAIMGGGG